MEPAFRALSELHCVAAEIARRRQNRTGGAGEARGTYPTFLYFIRAGEFVKYDLVTGQIESVSSLVVRI